MSNVIDLCSHSPEVMVGWEIDAEGGASIFLKQKNNKISMFSSQALRVAAQLLDCAADGLEHDISVGRIPKEEK